MSIAFSRRKLELPPGWAAMIFALGLAASSALGDQKMQWLRTDGMRIVNEDGQTVYLRGTNFGSWLLIEPWIPSMMPRPDSAELEKVVLRSARKIGKEEEAKQVFEEFKGKPRMKDMEFFEAWRNRFTELAGQVAAARLALDVLPHIGLVDESRLWKLFEKRFSKAQVQELKDAFRSSWINEQDVVAVKNANMNMVRVPFFCQLLEDDDHPGVYRDDGWRWLDAVVGWGRKHGVYILLDMHGVPGGQNDAGHSGVAMRNLLWFRPEWQDRAAALWKAVASRYADEPTVLGYDLMNEPWGAQTPKVLHDFHDRLYKTIREVDSRHIIVMEEGYKQLWTFPSPARRGWTNVVYSLHFYMPRDKGTQPFESLARRLMPQWYLLMRSYNVPLFVGEFSSQTEEGGGAAAMEIAFREMNRYGFHWAPWTYKKVDMDPPQSFWGLYMWPGKWPGVQVNTGSFKLIKEAMARYDSANFVPHKGYLEAYKRHGCSAPGADAELLKNMDARIAALMPGLKRTMGVTLQEDEALKTLATCKAAAEAFRELGGDGSEFLEMGPFYFELGGHLPEAAERAVIREFGSIQAFSDVWMRLSAGIWFVPRGGAEMTSIDADLTVAPETVQLLARLKPKIDAAAAEMAGRKGQSVDVTQP